MFMKSVKSTISLLIRQFVFSLLLDQSGFLLFINLFKELPLIFLIACPLEDRKANVREETPKSLQKRAWDLPELIRRQVSTGSGQAASEAQAEFVQCVKYS